MTLILGTVKSRWLKSARRTAHLRARPLTAFDRKSRAALGAAAWSVFSRSWRTALRRSRHRAVDAEA